VILRYSPECRPLQLEDGLAFTRDNVLGTHRLLEACRGHAPLRRLVFASTDEVYGDLGDGAAPLPEDASLAPTNPYAASKAAAEMVCRAFRRAFGLPIVVTRCCNAYGPHQFPDKLVARFALLAARGAPLPVHGDGGAIRGFLHVDDVAEALDVVMHRGAVGETYNVGADDERTVLQVARDVRAAVAALGAAPVALTHVRDRAPNDRRYFIASDRLRALGWAPRTPWADGLRRTVAWYARLQAELGVGRRWREPEASAALGWRPGDPPPRPGGRRA
jgi:UDP-glucose 4,6-dehydratase